MKLVGDNIPFLKEKQFFFLCALPRAGNTLLGSILNQDKRIALTANSIVVDIIYQLELLKFNRVFLNFPDYSSINNIINNVFNNYYKNWETSHIIDRAPWGNPVNLNLLKNIIKEPKFIILIRPVVECVASFIKKEKPSDIKERCEELLHQDGIIGKNLISIKNLIDSKENILIIEYDNFVNTPEKELKKIYNYLNIDYTNLNLNNFEQFQINNIKYNDSMLSTDLHTIRTDKIIKESYLVEDYLPKFVIEFCKKIDFYYN
jgi:hypothetical protein